MSRPAERLLASQEGLYSLELVSSSSVRSKFALVSQELTVAPSTPKSHASRSHMKQFTPRKQNCPASLLVSHL